MHHFRRGHGRPLLLVHGLGSDGQSWSPILAQLAREREVIAIDLPGHGRTPPLPEGNGIATYADALERFISDEGLEGVDLVGSSVGGRLVLELARRGTGGAVVALAPGGFWDDRGARYLGVTLGASIRLLRALRPALGLLARNPVSRTLLLAQLTPRPWAVDPDVARHEMESFADTPVFKEVLRDLVHGPRQAGIPPGDRSEPITMVWGRRDRVTLPKQAERAAQCFADARIEWLARCGHFPHWDRPDATVRLILETTAPSTPAG